MSSQALNASFNASSPRNNFTSLTFAKKRHLRDRERHSDLQCVIVIACRSSQVAEEKADLTMLKQLSPQQLDNTLTTELTRARADIIRLRAELGL